MSKVTDYQDDFSPDDVVQDYYESKILGLQKMRAQVVTDVLKRRRRLEDSKMGGHLLDVGCGHGEVTRILASNFSHTIGIDSSYNQITKANTIENPHQIDFKTGTAENLPVADGTIDVITVILTLHFIDIEVFVKECVRVLKPNGIALFYLDIMSTITSTENGKLPVVSNSIKEMYDLCLGTAEALSHPQRHVLDHYQALYDAIDFPNKSKVEIKAENVCSLEALRRYFLAVPFYARLGTDSENPLIALFQSIKHLWCMDDEDDKDILVRTCYRSIVVILEKYH